MKKIKFVIYILIATLFFTKIFAVEIGDKSPVLIGKYLFENNSDTNRYFTLNQYIGKIKVVNFFYTGCAPCFKEIPEIAKLEKQFPHIIFVLANVYSEKENILKKYFSKLSSYPKKVIVSSEIIRSRFKKEEDRDLVLPATFIMDENNKIINFFYGYNKKLPNKISQILKKLS